ncbi:MAG: phosphoribosylglycinamide formyltransferase [Nitrososphaerales archaeon]
MAKVMFLASGRGSNFQSFVDHVKLGVLKSASLSALIVNHQRAKVVERAKEAKIPTFEIEGVSGRKFVSDNEKEQARLAFDAECISVAKTYGIDYVILAGFDQILTKSFVDNYPLRILNIHPAYDLKSFGGKNMVGMKVHSAVIASKRAYSGCSVHLVTSSVDEGPSILKEKVPVLPNDSAETLEKRILLQEHLVYPKALQLLIDGRVLVSDSGERCFVDLYSNNWDIDWDARQESYLDYLKSS